MQYMYMCTAFCFKSTYQERRIPVITTLVVVVEDKKKKKKKTE